MKFFIALAHPDGTPHLMVQDDSTGPDVAVLFDSEDQANAVAELHGAARAWGYEVYPWPHRASHDGQER